MNWSMFFSTVSILTIQKNMSTTKSYSGMCKNFSSKPSDLSTSQDFNIFPELSITAIYLMGYFLSLFFLFYYSTNPSQAIQLPLQTTNLSNWHQFLRFFSPFIHFLNSPFHASTCKSNSHKSIHDQATGPDMPICAFSRSLCFIFMLPLDYFLHQGNNYILLLSFSEIYSVRCIVDI